MSVHLPLEGCIKLAELLLVEGGMTLVRLGRVPSGADGEVEVLLGDPCMQITIGNGKAVEHPENERLCQEKSTTYNCND